MSTIKAKQGNCEEKGCSYFGALIAKKCPTHYWRHRASLKEKKSAERTGIAKTRSVIKKKPAKKKDPELAKWFMMQLSKAPKKCEECQKSLASWINWLPFSIIAHILPKREKGFPTVATHPENRMYYCGDCHTDFDTKGEDHARQMKSLPLMKTRYKSIEKELSPEDIERVPQYLKE